MLSDAAVSAAGLEVFLIILFAPLQESFQQPIAAGLEIKSVIRLSTIYDVLVKALYLGSVRLSKSTRSHRPLGLAGQEKDQNHRRLPDGYGLFKQGKVHGQVPGK